MDRPGEKLKRARERLGLTYRDVEEASQRIAVRHASDEFALPLSRLADIENAGRVPSIFRIYTLCAIYRLNVNEVFHWYGVPMDRIAADAVQLGLPETHEIRLSDDGVGIIPQMPDAQIDLRKTSFVSHLVRRWGRLPLSLLDGLDLKKNRYGFIGLDDWSMFPLLQPGALVMIDESRRKIINEGWTNEFDRPIYFLEHRNGYLCGWCTQENSQLVVQPHPSSQEKPAIFAFPAGIDVVGQVTGVAMLLGSRRHRHARISAAPSRSLNP